MRVLNVYNYGEADIESLGVCMCIYIYTLWNSPNVKDSEKK